MGFHAGAALAICWQNTAIIDAPRGSCFLARVNVDRPSPAAAARPVTVLTFGGFDLFHVGHLRLLQQAAALGDRLVVGVSTDEYIRRSKGREPVHPEAERLEIVRACRYVSAAFLQRSLKFRDEDITAHGTDILVFGADWQGRYDHLSRLCRVVYLPRTPSVSTTAIIERLSGV